MRLDGSNGSVQGVVLESGGVFFMRAQCQLTNTKSIILLTMSLCSLSLHVIVWGVGILCHDVSAWLWGKLTTGWWSVHWLDTIVTITITLLFMYPTRILQHHTRLSREMRVCSLSNVVIVLLKLSKQWSIKGVSIGCSFFFRRTASE